MDINTYIKFEIILQNITLKNILLREKDSTLMKYTQMVLTDMKYQFMRQSLSTVDVLINTLKVLQIGIVLWVIVTIEKR